MAKHRKRRGRRWDPNNKVVQIQNEGALGTPAANAATAGVLTVVSDEAYRCISLTATWTIRGLTVGEGPIHVGVSHGDYTAAEIEEWIESSAAMTRGDLIARERANRMIRRVGTFSGNFADEVLNDGKPITTRMNWVHPTGVVLDFWTYNASGAILATGSFVAVMGKLFIRFI